MMMRHKRSIAYQSLFLVLFSVAQGFDHIVDITKSRQLHKGLVLKDARLSNDPGLSRREIFKGVTAAGLVLPGVVQAREGSTITVQAGAVPTARLGGGKSSLEISRTMQGFWQLAGGHGRYTEVDAISNMQAHFDSGITTLDTADIYGPSELIVGRFLKSRPNAIPCTKFCCFRFLEDITREETRQRVLKSCERLQVQKLPLLQFFWSDYNVKKYVDVALWLTELREEGLIQEIGATNFNLKHLKELKEAGVPIVSHQVQLSALDRRPVQSGMTEWCAENDVSLIAFGTVCSGILSKRYLGKAAPAAEDLNTASLRMYSKTASRFGDWKLVQELLQTLNAIATEVRESGRCRYATIANVAQRFILQTPAVASVLIGVRNQDHIAENLRTHAFALTPGEIDAIEKVVSKRNGPVGDVWDIERGLI